MNPIVGIYKITSPSNKVYIGQSVDINRRWRNHRESISCKSRRSKLKSSFQKYGFDNHRFEVLQECLEEKLNELEKYYVDLFQTFNSKHGLNLKDGGRAGKLSVESIAKMALSLTGKMKSEETKAKHRLYRPTEEQKRKISLAQIGRKLSQETKDKIALAHTGRKLSDERKIKCSLGRKGKPHTEEFKAKRRAYRHTPEARAKISLANKGREVTTKMLRAKISRIGIKRSEETIAKMRGLKRSAETKAKISEVNKKIILNTDNGVFYLGVIDAANSMNLNIGTMRNRLSGHMKNNTPFIYA